MYLAAVSITNPLEKNNKWCIEAFRFISFNSVFVHNHFTDFFFFVIRLGVKLIILSPSAILHFASVIPSQEMVNVSDLPLHLSFSVVKRQRIDIIEHTSSCFLFCMSIRGKPQHLHTLLFGFACCQISYLGEADWTQIMMSGVTYTCNHIKTHIKQKQLDQINVLLLRCTQYCHKQIEIN